MDEKTKEQVDEVSADLTTFMPIVDSSRRQLPGEPASLLLPELGSWLLRWTGHQKVPLSKLLCMLEPQVLHDAQPI